MFYSLNVFDFLKAGPQKHISFKPVRCAKKVADHWPKTLTVRNLRNADKNLHEGWLKLKNLNVMEKNLNSDNVIQFTTVPKISSLFIEFLGCCTNKSEIGINV